MTSGKSNSVFIWIYGKFLDYLVVEMETRTVFPLGPLDADQDLWHLGALYAAVGGSYHCDGDPILDISFIEFSSKHTLTLLSRIFLYIIFVLLQIGNFQLVQFLIIFYHVRVLIFKIIIQINFSANIFVYSVLRDTI